MTEIAIFLAGMDFAYAIHMKTKQKKTNKINRKKARQLAVRKKETELRKRKFFDPTLDPVFKKIFKNMKTLVHFLNAILRLDGKRRFVYATSVRPTINLSSPDKKQKIVRFDVHARTKDGHFIDVEMQRAGHEDFLDRIDLYSSLLTVNSKILMDSELTKKQRADHPYRMPSVYSIWICNFGVDFCKNYREELALFRCSDLETRKPLPIYPKKRYIIIDLTKYVPQKGNSLENKWIELFKTMPKAKRIPKGVDDVLKDVYECLKISNATSKFIKKVATYMVTKEEILTRLGTARREGEAIGIEKVMKLLRSKRVSPELLAAVQALK